MYLCNYSIHGWSGPYVGGLALADKKSKTVAPSPKQSSFARSSWGLLCIFKSGVRVVFCFYSGFRVDGTIPQRWFRWTPFLNHILGVVPSTLKPLYWYLGPPAPQTHIKNFSSVNPMPALDNASISDHHGHVFSKDEWGLAPLSSREHPSVVPWRRKRWPTPSEESIWSDEPVQELKKHGDSGVGCYHVLSIADRCAPVHYPLTGWDSNTTPTCDSC